MLEDPLGVVTEPVKEITPEEASKEQLVLESEEADTTSTGSEEAELFSRGGSAPLVVEDADDEVQEVEAPPKSAAELAELKIQFHRTT